MDVNDPPDAVDDSATVNEGGTVTTLDGGHTTVLHNDTDPDQADSLTVDTTPVSGPDHGSLTLNGDGAFSYTHDGSETAGDSFTYQVCDDGLPQECDTATVSITILPINDAPVADDDAYSADEGETLAVSAPGVLSNDGDVDSDTLTATLVSDVSYGTLALNGNGSFTYEHDGSENHSDSFTYKANDGQANSNVVTVTFTITPVNDVPVFISTPVLVATEKAAYTYSIVASDAEGDTLTITAPLLPAWLTLTDNGDGMAVLKGTPGEGSAGEYAVELQAKDAAGATGTQHFAIAVSAAEPDGFFIYVPVVLRNK